MGVTTEGALRGVCVDGRLCGDGVPALPDGCALGAAFVCLHVGRAGGCARLGCCKFDGVDGAVGMVGVVWLIGRMSP
jgi:hypothetical protein